MDILEALEHLRDRGTEELDIYWLEENEDGDPYWWCDVINDRVCDLCKTHWSWTVMSRVEYENEEPGDSTGSDTDWFIIVDEEKFSDDLVGDRIKDWLRDRGFDFKVNVIDPEGTVEMNLVLALAEEARNSPSASSEAL